MTQKECDVRRKKEKQIKNVSVCWACVVGAEFDACAEQAKWCAIMEIVLEDSEKWV